MARGWIPVDDNGAVEDSSKRDDVFGHDDENRLEFQQGSGIDSGPPPQRGPPLNVFINPHAQIDGKHHELVDRKVTFADLE